MNEYLDKKNRPGRRLHFWVAGVIFFVALIFTLITGIRNYSQTYEQERATAARVLRQLVSTLEETAAISAYLNNQQLALDVTRGLVKNDIIGGAAITINTVVLAQTGTINIQQSSSVDSFSLISPFTPGETVGKIHVQPKEQVIEDKARSTSLNQARMLAIHTLLITLLVMFLVGRVLTKPLTRLAQALHHIEPGSDKTLAAPNWHDQDEIGWLVADINQLLLSVRNTINDERVLRTRVETLEKRFRLIFERASAGIFLMDQQGSLLSSNHAFDQLVGIDLAERMRKSGQPKVTDLFKNSEELHATLERVGKRDMSSAIDLEFRTNDGQQTRWLQCLFSSALGDDGTLFIEGLINDITERANREMNMLFEAGHDPLTGLFNRRAGEMKLLRAIERADKGKGASFALLLVDLDRFKPINDGYGHVAGDQVLIEITRRLLDSVRGEDIVIRWGGDEFVLGLLKGHGPLDPIPVVEKLIAEIGQEIILDNNQMVSIGASIGIALFPTHAEELDPLVSFADQAMYEVKETGRNGYRVYGEMIHNMPSEA